jgi:hypothetical protein
MRKKIYVTEDEKKEARKKWNAEAYAKLKASPEKYAKRKSKAKEWSVKNADFIKDNARKYYQENREKLRLYSKKRYEENKEEDLARSRKYQKENRAKRNAYHVEWRMRSLQNKLSCSLRKRLTKALKNNTKCGSSVSDLGCSIDFLREYFGWKFTDGMSWANYGEWHIDHIKPLSMFDLTDREQFLEACHFTNLQPLWAKDNWSKNNKVDGIPLKDYAHQKQYSKRLAPANSHEPVELTYVQPVAA